MVEVGDYQGLRVFDYHLGKGTFFIASGCLVSCQHVLSKVQWQEDFIQPEGLDLLFSKKNSESSSPAPQLALDWRWSKNIPSKAIVIVNNQLMTIEGNLGLDLRRTDVSTFMPNDDDNYRLFHHGNSGSPIVRYDNNVIGVLTGANQNERLIATIGFTSRSITLPIQNAGIPLLEL